MASLIEKSLHLVDTDILIDAGRHIEKATHHLEFLDENFSLGISIITEFELIVGCQNKQDLRLLSQFLTHFQIIPLSEEISLSASGLLKSFRLSHGLLIADALIAATAMMTGSSFSTKNQKDFRFIDGLALFEY